MNTNDNNTTDNTRPFGFWITAVDRLMRAEFATVFEDEGVTRRDWRMLNRIDGTSATPAASDRPLNAHKLHRLLELGWVERTNEGWTLTEPGALAKQRLSVAVDEIRARVAGAVSPEEYATMTNSLEKIAREFGWAEGQRLPRDARHGRGGHGHHGRHGGEGKHGRFGHGRRGFGHGFGRALGEDCGDNDRGYGEHGHRGHRDFGRFRGHGAPAAHIHIHHHG